MTTKHTRKTWELYEILGRALEAVNLAVPYGLEVPMTDDSEGSIEIDHGAALIDVCKVKRTVKSIAGEREVDGYDYNVSRTVVIYNYPHAPDDADYVDVATHTNPVDAVRCAIGLLIDDRINGAMECWQPTKYVIRALCPQCGRFDALSVVGTTHGGQVEMEADDCDHERHEDPLFWSNKWGWTGANEATVFDGYERQTFDLPVGPDKCEFQQASWVPAESSDWTDYLDEPERWEP